MKFTKIHSLGNDFLIIDEGDSPGLAEKEALARLMCKRHTGVGADGLLILSVKDRAKGLANFQIFNADGTEPEISGNGLRCAAAYLFHRKKVDSSRMLFYTTVGSRECEVKVESRHLYSVRIEMGTPRFTSEDIPFDDGAFHQTIIDYPLNINKKVYPVTLVSLGNPHCGMFFDRLPSRIEWHQIGYEIEFHPFFPKRINIEFIRVLNRKEIEVFFWERGVGETLSSGSGSCAAAVASILKNQTDHTVHVRTSMGSVLAEWEDQKVYQTAPAQVVFEGEFLAI